MLDYIFMSRDATGPIIVKAGLSGFGLYLCSFLIVWVAALLLSRIPWLEGSKNVYVRVYTGWAMALALYTIAYAVGLVSFVKWLNYYRVGLAWAILMFPPILVSGISAFFLAKSAVDQINQELS